MYLYIAIFPNNKRYVGITKDFRKRRDTHKSRAKNGYDGVFYNAIRKYGWDNLSWNIADGYKSYDDLCKCEIQEIAKHNTTDRRYGYNVDLGGRVRQGFKHTNEWKQTMSERMSGKNNPTYGRKLTDEQKEHLSKINSGELNPRYGKSKSKIEKEKITQGLKKYFETHDGSFLGKKHTKEAKNKISKKNSGKNNGMYGKKVKHTQETKDAISKKNSGKKNGMYGKKVRHTQETKNKISEKNSGERNGQSKINLPIARKIRERYNTGKYTYKDLQQIYCISVSQISQIINNKVWKEES